MSSTCRRTLLVGLVLIFAVVLTHIAVSAAPPTAKEIARWIEQLGDNSFAVREGASKKLWAAGSSAETALEGALKSDDAEVVRRARDILDKFKWGIYPDTPAEIVALVRAYQATEGNPRREILQKLLQGGPAGLQVVLKISRAEKDLNQRKILGNLVSSMLPAAFPQVLEDGKYEQFETLLEIGHNSSIIHHNQYTAYWLLRGKLDERIAHFCSVLERTPTEKRCAETLAYLYRAKGDLPAARKAAEKSERADLLEGILYEAADWKALAARPDVAGTDNTIEKWAFRAAYARLAGNRNEFESALSDLSKLAEKGLERERYQFAGVKAFLLNDRPVEGLALLAKTPDRQPVLFEILCAQLKYREAMALVEQPRRADSGEQKQLDILKARMLYFLGEKDKAQMLFNRLAEQIKPSDTVDPSFWITRLLEAEYRVGLNDLAFEHCAKALSDGIPKGVKIIRAETYLRQVFPDRTETAEVWWELLRQKFKEETNSALLKRLRDLMEAKVAAKEVKVWIEEADRLLSTPNTRLLPAGEIGRQRRAMAEAAAAAKLDDLACSLLEKADTTEALRRLGDLLAGKKQWTKAAEHYRQAWRKSLTTTHPITAGKQADPLPLYLAGDALVKAGQDKEGMKLMEQSHWVLLGDAPARFAFLRALVERGHKEAAQRETDLLLRVSEPNSLDSGAALRRRAVAALAHKEYAKAADGYEQSMLRCLRADTIFTQSSAYAVVPAQIHQLRASALLADGRFDEAAKQIELALATSPGSVELPISLVPELVRRGRKKEAAALFDRSFGAYEKVCRDYPRCSWAHNSAAWMSACCRRNLDKALEHAKRAVELAPTNAGYLDTLAEVHFQRGEKDQAVALQERVVELDPKKTYFRKQLKRLEAGDPAAERPAEDED